MIKFKSAVDGKLHSDDGGPSLILSDGTKFWHKHGSLHRDGGPARYAAVDHQQWYQNGKRHRMDGPAVIRGDAKEWWLNGVRYLDLSHFISANNGLPDQQKVFLKLKYG